MRNVGMRIISTYEYNELKKKASRAEDAEASLDRALEEGKERLADLNDRIKGKEATIANMQDKFELNEKKVVAALEDKLAKEISKLESAHNKDITELERKLVQEKQGELEKMMKDNYVKLSDSMTKLHEEGNAQTKFMQETTQTLLKSASGFARSANTSTQITHDK